MNERIPPGAKTCPPRMLRKCALFVVRPGEFLVFEHPLAGLQVPAGTIELGESVPQGAVRELHEESGLSISVDALVPLGIRRTALPEGSGVLLDDLAARPEGRIGRGHLVQVVRADDHGVEVVEQIVDHGTGEVVARLRARAMPDQIAQVVERHYFAVVAAPETPSSWTCAADGHVFAYRWLELGSGATLQPPQDQWFADVLDGLHALLR